MIANSDAKLLTSMLKDADVGDLLRIVRKHGSTFCPIHCSAAWSTLGKQRGACQNPHHRPDIEQLLRVTKAHIADWTCNARSFANIVHGAAKSRVSGARGLFVAGAEAAPARLHEFNAQDIANTAWAYATARQVHPALLDAIAKAAEARLKRDFRPQHFSNTAWAFATVHHSAPALFEAIAEASLPRLSDFKPQEIANTVWAYAVSKCSAPALFDAIAAEVVPRMREFNGQALSNTAWAYATAEHSAPALLDAIAAEAAPKLGSFAPQALANTVWAYATMGRAAPALFDAVAKATVPRLKHDLHDITSQGLSSMVWSYASLGHSAPELFDAVATAVAAKLSIISTISSSTKTLANMAWAFAVSDTLSDALFGLSTLVKLCEKEQKSFGPSDLYQLHQWELWVEERNQEWPRLSPKLSACCRESFLASKSTPSASQRSVVAALALGWPTRETVRTRLGYSVDAVVDFEGREVAVEVDGPSHFVGRTPKGATSLQRRQLRAAGWALLVVPHWEWDDLDGDADAQHAYLGRGLRAAANAEATAGGLSRLAGLSTEGEAQGEGQGEGQDADKADKGRGGR
jgi:hypothetical protein